MPPDLQTAVSSGRSARTFACCTPVSLQSRTAELLLPVVLTLMMAAAVAIADSGEVPARHRGPDSIRSAEEIGAEVRKTTAEYALFMEQCRMRALFRAAIMVAGALAGFFIAGVALLLYGATKDRIPAGESGRRRPQVAAGTVVLLLVAAAGVPVFCCFRARAQAIEVAIQKATRELEQATEEWRRVQAALRRRLASRANILQGLRQWRALRVSWNGFLTALPEYVGPEMQLLIFHSSSGVQPEGRPGGGPRSVKLVGKSRGEAPIVALRDALETKDPFRSVVTNTHVGVEADTGPNATEKDLVFTITAECKQPDVVRPRRFGTQSEMERKIRAISGPCMLHPSMGINHAIPAHGAIGRAADRCGMDISGVRDGRVSPFPPIEGVEGFRDLRTYNYPVRTKDTFRRLVSLCTALEDSNPYLSVLYVDIRANADNPTMHTAVFLVAWPIWNLGPGDLRSLRKPRTESERAPVRAAPVAHLAEVQKKLAGSRDPFRPAGWQPPRPVPRWDYIREQIQLAGLAGTGKEKTAAIRLKGCSGATMVKVGEILDIRHGDFLYKWRVTSISEDNLGLQRISATPID